jgi:ribosomal protein S16
LAEAHRSATKKFQEILGFYHPRTKEFGIKNEERLKYWLGQHVQVSPTVHNLLVEKKLITAGKVKAWRPKKKTGEAVAAASSSPSAPEAAPATPAEIPQA